MNTRRKFLLSTSAAALFFSMRPSSVLAEALNQVRIIFGFPAGSAGDVISRRIAEKFAGTEFSRNQGVVENRPGAGGRLAMEALKNAPADGSVLAHTPFSVVALYPHVFKKLSYDPFADFSPIATTAISHHGLSVGSVVPSNVNSIKEFVLWCQANPDKANYGSPGPGSTPHFMGALIGLQTNTDIKHIPYRGMVPGITDASAGQIACMIGPLGDHLQHHKSGKLRLLATSGSKRSSFVPNVATFAEQGFSDLTVEEWYGLYAPAKTPASTINAASAAVRAALNEPSVKETLNTIGLLPGGSTPEEMARSAKAEFDKWGPLIRQVGFTAES